MPELNFLCLFQGVQLYIDIQDDDGGGSANFIDALLINYNQTVGMPLRQTYSGVHGFVTMDLNITVFCVGNFAEPDCSSQCVTGFTGPDCLKVDNCVGVNCSGNGLCVNGMDSFMCNCSAGYNGSECEMNVDDCLSNPCASIQLVNVWMEWIALPVAVTKATLDSYVRLTLTNVRELTVVEMENVWME